MNSDENGRDQYNIIREQLPEASFHGRIEDEIMLAYDIGESMMNSEKNLVPDVFAANTANYALDVREDLKKMASNRIESEAAEIASYKVKQVLRDSGLKKLEEGPEGEERNPAEEYNWDSWLEDFLQAFVMFDKISDSSTVNTSPGMNPNEKALELLTEEQWERTLETGMGEYLTNQLVHDQKWISFLSGDGTYYDSEVIGYLEDIEFNDY